MNDASFCVCGSGELYHRCHGHMHKNSMVAKLFRLQAEIDIELEKQRLENGLVLQCKAGCSECCSKCFCVSETEFVQIFDMLILNWSLHEIKQIIGKSMAQWRVLESEYPDVANKINGRILLKDLVQTNEIMLPFPCIFLDENKCCSIYNVRPLICRTHGVGITNLMNNNKPCSILPPVLSASDQYANLIAYSKELTSFMFIKDDDRFIFRRPLPLFYYFVKILANISNLYDFRNYEFYRALISLDECEYIKVLKKE